MRLERKIELDLLVLGHTCATRTEGRFVEWVGEQYIFPRESFASAASNGDLKVNLEV